MKFITFEIIFFIFLSKSLFVSANFQITIREFDIFVKNDTEYVNLDTVKLKRKSHNETHRFYGELIILKNITEDMHLYVVAELFMKQGGEFRKLAYHLKGSYCEFLEKDNTFTPSITKKIGMQKKCPIMTGTYSLGVDGWMPDVTQFPPVLSSGNYMVEGKLFDGDRLAQGGRIYANVLNKVGGRIGL